MVLVSLPPFCEEERRVDLEVLCDLTEANPVALGHSASQTVSPTIAESNIGTVCELAAIATAMPASSDYYVATSGRGLSATNEPDRRSMVEDLEVHARATGVTLFGLNDRAQGIVHVVGPEQGLSQPGMIIVCGDSHTATHGAVGALAFGVGDPQPWRAVPEVGERGGSGLWSVPGRPFPFNGATAARAAEAAVLDGGVMASDADGRANFARLHVRWTRPGTIHLWAFDLLAFNAVIFVLSR